MHEEVERREGVPPRALSPWAITRLAPKLTRPRTRYGRPSSAAVYRSSPVTNSKRAGPSGRSATPRAFAACCGRKQLGAGDRVRGHRGEQHVATGRVEVAGERVELVDRADGLGGVAVLLQTAPAVEGDGAVLPQRAGRALDLGGGHAGDRLRHGGRHLAAPSATRSNTGRQATGPPVVLISRTPNSASRASSTS